MMLCSRCFSNRFYPHAFTLLCSITSNNIYCSGKKRRISFANENSCVGMYGDDAVSDLHNILLWLWWYQSTVLIEFCRHLHFDTKSSEEVTKVDEIYKLIWVHFDFILCQTSVVSVVRRLDLDQNVPCSAYLITGFTLHLLCFADNDLEEPTKLIRVIYASSSSCCLVDYQIGKGKLTHYVLAIYSYINYKHIRKSRTNMLWLGHILSSKLN